jgi:kynurenine 3-monooxygenase
MKKNITILGAGLVGSLLACMLEKRGYQVQVFERRPDMRKQELSAGRSINLAMSKRGWTALEKAGIKERFEEIAIPMYGREIHQSNGETNFQAYGKNNEAIYSISRGQLNVDMMNLAEKAGTVFHFNHKCVDVDLESNKVTFETESGKEHHTAELLIGADGAFSSLRTEYAKTDRYNYQQFYINHGYKELHIPPTENGEHQINKNALHIWPRGKFMVIALPNTDGSFTCTLFFPFDGKPSFNTVKTKEDVKLFFEEYFPDVIDRMPDLLDDYFNNPTSSLVTVKSSPWIYKNKSLIIGDAAHAIVPFYGQGMNAAFEDARVLVDLIDEDPNHDNWDEILKRYNQARVDNGQAIADLAIRNFYEMSDHIADPEFLRRKKLEKEIGKIFPEKFNSVYEQVSFTNNDYSVAWERQKAQDQLMQKILDIEEFREMPFTKSALTQLEFLLDEYQEVVS